RKLDKMEWVLKEYFKKYDFVCAADFLGVKEELRITNYEAKKVNSSKFENQKTETENEKPRVTIVIPCYNEEAALPYLADTLRGVEADLSANYEPQFIFVDDASRDATFDKLRELFGERENVQIVRHEHNQGVAAGIMTGLKTARTEIVCSMDCDCTYDPRELKNMIPLLSQDVDMVTASPYHKDGGVRNVPDWRLFLSKGASFLYRRALRAKLSTYTSCFRVYRRSSVVDLDLREQGFLGVAEMLGKLDLRGGKIVEYPAVLEVRLFGFSKMKTARTIFGHLKLLSHLSRMRVFGKTEAIETSLTSEEKPSPIGEMIENEKKL
ncbi:MAG TPA: glycosyltransferase family 2 protein, partial [Pyrinomonadaceae bacterium]|nr:glycosyltransferase family 2 protein [Pyrinomonadaceae bacterium]